MGKVWSLAYRPIKTFNVENRAHKLLSKEKPTPAPRYEVDAQRLKNALKENPNAIKELARKNVALDKRLKDIYVSSEGNNPIIIRVEPSKPLPQSRELPTQFDFSIKEPENITPGFISLRLIYELLSRYNVDRSLSAKTLAEEYNLKKSDVESLLKYYGSFDMHMPKKNKKGVLKEYIPFRFSDDTKQISS